jgi:hypothetical protein
MGTSVSQPSPQTPNWNAVATTYINDTVPVDRVVDEIWRAATNQPIGNLSEDLGSPTIAECLKIAQTATSREQALHDARRAIVRSRQPSLATEIAQRAIVESFASTEERTVAFTQALFSQAGNYLVSRDLPGYVGLSERTRTVSDTITLKNEIRSEIASRVARIPITREIADNPVQWRNYVETATGILRGE